MNVRRPAAVLLASALVVGGAVAAAPSAQAATARVSGFTLSTTAVNTTDADRDVTVRLRVQAGAAVTGVGLDSDNLDVAGLPFRSGWNAYDPRPLGNSQMTRVSGTDRDGVYQLVMRVQRSTRGPIDFKVLIAEGDNEQTFVSADALRAAGQNPRVTTTSTAALPKVGNLKGRTVTRRGSVGGFPTVYRNGVVTYSLTGFAAGLQIVSQSGCVSANGQIFDRWEADGEFEFGSRSLGVCRLTLRPFNGSGFGADVSVSFF